jgi:hypothetical protein
VRRFGDNDPKRMRHEGIRVRRRHWQIFKRRLEEQAKPPPRQQGVVVVAIKSIEPAFNRHTAVFQLNKPDRLEGSCNFWLLNFVDQVGLARKQAIQLTLRNVTRFGNCTRGEPAVAKAPAPICDVCSQSQYLTICQKISSCAHNVGQTTQPGFSDRQGRRMCPEKSFIADSTLTTPRIERPYMKNSIASDSLVMRYSLLGKPHLCRMLSEELKYADRVTKRTRLQSCQPHQATTKRLATPYVLHGNKLRRCASRRRKCAKKNR